MIHRKETRVKEHPLYPQWRYACHTKTICDEWKSDFKSFCEIIGNKPDGMSLCRINQTKPLSKDNFIWKDNPRTVTHELMAGIDNYAKSRVGREKHPLWDTYYHARRMNRLSDEWLKDFWLFIKEVGEKKDGHSFQQINKLKLLDKNNFYWKEKIIIKSDNERENRKAYMREYRKRNPEAHKGYDLKKSYGITSEQYQDMLLSQNFICAICFKAEIVVNKSGIVQSLAVDHNHTTGAIRGLLCQGCNQAIGNFNEDIDKLQSAIDYLKKYS